MFDRARVIAQHRPLTYPESSAAFDVDDVPRDEPVGGFVHANLAVFSGVQAVDEAADGLVARNIIYVERGGRFRVRERTVLRYYARTIEHLLAGPRRVPRTH